MNVHQTTIVIQMQTVPTLRDHLTVLANMDIKEMALIVKVGIKHIASFQGAIIRVLTYWRCVNFVALVLLCFHRRTT
jgi:hypothetical protein